MSAERRIEGAVDLAISPAVLGLCRAGFTYVQAPGPEGVGGGPGQYSLHQTVDVGC